MKHEGAGMRATDELGVEDGVGDWLVGYGAAVPPKESDNEHVKGNTDTRE